jgi:hypothetical protein
LADTFSQPFLALTAQLPYGASSHWKNVLTCFYAVGNPILLLYSLTLTAVYRLWIRKEFQAILEEDPLVPDHFRKRAKAAQYILQNCHQVPIKVLQGDQGYLSSAVVLQENTPWWQRLQREIEQRRRPLTQSLGAQMFWVAVSQVFVWIATMQKAGDTSIGTGLASGLVLLWMLPVVWGTYEIGNFPNSNSIKDAIIESEGKFVLAGTTGALPMPPDLDQSKTAIVQRHSDSLQEYVPSVTKSVSANSLTNTDGSGIELPDLRNAQLPGRQYDSEIQSNHGDRLPLQFAWLSVQGDEVETGATMNYGRLHTSRVTASHIIDTFKVARRNMINRQSPKQSPLDQAQDLEAADRFWGTRDQVAKFCGQNIQPGALSVFKDSKRPGKPPASVVSIGAAIFALLVTWGSLGAGILVAYLTPTKGLGCFSGSILIYGLLSTVSFLLFWWTGRLSWSYCNQVENRTRNSVCKRFGGVLAILTRLCAKFIAFLNAIWEITWTLLAYSNIFGNCWCDTVYFDRGDTAYTTIFIGTSAISDVSRHIWYGGLFLSLIMCLVAFIFFSVSRESRSDRRQLG